MTSFIIFLFTGGLAGLIGALTGLGGGIVIIPLLTLGFGVSMHYAVGASLISIIGTSSGSASSYVKEGYTNIRIGIFLEVGSTLGAIVGALIAGLLPGNVLGIVFGCILLITLFLKARKKEEHHTILNKGSLSDKLKLYGTFPDEKTGLPIKYASKNPMGGFSVMSMAGALSGMLGIGGGAFKVLAMDDIMKLPFKVSTTTSNFMIGVTATTGALIYFQRGEVEPMLAAPLLIGSVAGAFFGAKLFMKMNTKILRKIFSFVVAVVAFYMIFNGLKNNFS